MNLLEKSFEKHIICINNNYIFNTYNENEISINEEISRIEKNISCNENENEISRIDNEIDIFNGNNDNDDNYIFKSPNISERYNFNDSYETNDFKNNYNTVYKNENENDNNKLELYEKPPLIEEANLEKTSKNTKIILKKKRGRIKSKEIDESDDNNENRGKYSIDNLIRRTKTIVLNSMLQFDNKIISKAYNYNIGRGINTKILLKNEYSQKRDTKIEFNKNLLNKTQQEIFSEKISKKNKFQFPEDHNEILIKNLLEEKDEIKRNIFQLLFSMTFKECIQQICGNEYFECLEGLKQIYDEEMIKMKEEEDFKKLINDVLNNYEKKLNDRKPRKRK